MATFAAPLLDSCGVVKRPTVTSLSDAENALYPIFSTTYVG